MAAAKKGAAKAGPAKKAAKKQSRTSLYKVEGTKLERLSRFCPKCGAGVFMAKHKDGRYACGKCGFMER